MLQPNRLQCLQVDLKDKWRNLVRQGAVNPDTFPSPEGRSRPRAAVENAEQEAAAAGADPSGAPTHADAAEVPAVEEPRGALAEGGARM